MEALDFRHLIGVILDRFAHKLRELVGKRSRLIVLRVPFLDLWFRPFFPIEWIMLLGLWEPYVTGILKLRPGDLFIDVGAYVGYYSRWAASTVGRRGIVISIEPHPVNWSILVRNVFKFPQVRVFRAAAGERNGFTTLTLGEDPAGAVSHEAHDQYVRIRTVSIDNLSHSFPWKSRGHVYMKIDVEGSELRVIRGSSKFIRRYSPIIVMEVQRENLTRVRKLLPNYSLRMLSRKYYVAVVLHAKRGTS